MSGSQGFHLVRLGQAAFGDVAGCVSAAPGSPLFLRKTG